MYTGNSLSVIRVKIFPAIKRDSEYIGTSVLVNERKTEYVLRYIAFL